MSDLDGGRPPGQAAFVPELLERQDLIRLVHDLRAIVADQKATIARQGAAIAALQDRRLRPDGDPAASEPTTSATAAPNRRAAPLVPGFDYTIIFDGGAIGNPGRGYGSYQIVGEAGVVAEERLEYGDKVTNNQAEYRTLIGVLEDLRNRLGSEAADAAVAVRGDSQLVIHQVTGRWKVKHDELRPLHERAVSLLACFARVDVAWQRRDASVRVLGH